MVIVDRGLDVESSLMDSGALEELNPYTFFAAASLYTGRLYVPLPATTPGAASAGDLAAMADLINQAHTVAIFGGDGCREAQALTGKMDEVIATIEHNVRLL